MTPSISLLDVLFPTPCLHCGAVSAAGGPITALCPRCTQALPRHVWPAMVAVTGIRSCWFLAPYQGLGGALVRAGKYGRRERLLAELARHTARVARGALPRCDVIVPVPSAWYRVLYRGFSLPWMMGRELSRVQGVPVVRALGHGGAGAQAGRSRAARSRVARATIRPRRPLPDAPRVLLVDDVATTGSTAAACAQVLLEQGAAAVHLFTFASALS